jgi:hypothetical protein
VSMRQKAGTIGNIVGKNVPVSMTEVSLSRAHGDIFNHVKFSGCLGR